MKRLIFISVIIVSLLSLWNDYLEKRETEFNKIQEMESIFSEQFLIPEDTILIDYREIYPILLETAEQLQVNIFRTNTAYDRQGSITLNKYVLQTTNTMFWEKISLRSGTYLTTAETKESDSFLSTKQSNDDKQKGMVSIFGNKAVVNIRSLQESYKSLPVSGNYMVELDNNTTIEQFTTLLASNLMHHFIENREVEFANPFTYADFLSETESIQQYETDNLPIIELLIIVVVSVLLIYYIISQAKKTSILKMNGFSSFKVWKKIIGKSLLLLIISLYVISNLAASVISLVYHDITFLAKVIISQLIIFFTLISSTILAYIFITIIPIYQGLKKKTYQKMILIANNIIKIVIITFILITGFNAIYQYQDLQAKKESLKNWQLSNDYGMFYPLYVGNDTTRETNLKMHKTIDYDLYPYLNQLGAIYIDTQLYEPEHLIDYEPSVRYISVNLNYLRKFAVVDTNNEPITFSETDERYLVLVPEQYKDREEGISEFFKINREGTYHLEEASESQGGYNLTIPEHLKNTDISIIWMKQNQNFFAFNPKVFPHANNMINDPIVFVITENNSLTNEILSIRGGGASDPLKIKLIDNDIETTYKALLPGLKELKLDDNLKDLITINELVNDELIILRNDILSYTIIIVALLILALILIVQNITILFNVNQKKYTIKRIFGYSFIRIYYHYFFVLIVAFIVQLGIIFILRSSFLIRFNWLPILSILIVELLISAMMILLLERKNKLEIVKEGA